MPGISDQYVAGSIHTAHHVSRTAVNSSSTSTTAAPLYEVQSKRNCCSLYVYRVSTWYVYDTYIRGSYHSTSFFLVFLLDRDRVARRDIEQAAESRHHETEILDYVYEYVVAESCPLESHRPRSPSRTHVSFVVNCSWLAADCRSMPMSVSHSLLAAATLSETIGIVYPLT